MRSKPSGGAGPSTSAFSAHGFVSGVIAGGTGVLVGHGFDTLKVRSQVGAADGALSVAVLYRGILPPLITTGAARALYLGIFENAKRMLEPGVAEDELSLRSVGVAAAAARRRPRPAGRRVGRPDAGELQLRRPLRRVVVVRVPRLVLVLARPDRRADRAVPRRREPDSRRAQLQPVRRG